MDDCFCNEKHTCIVKIRSPNLENNRFWGNAALFLRNLQQKENKVIIQQKGRCYESYR